MEQATLNKNELYGLIKKAVREVLQEKIFRSWLDSLPEVSKAEMKDIEIRYGKPSRKGVSRTEKITL